MAKQGYESVGKAARERVWTQEMRDKLSASLRESREAKGTALSVEEYQKRKAGKAKRDAIKKQVAETGNHVIDQKVDRKGYVWLRVALHPIYRNKWVRRSHLVVAEKIGRKVLLGEVVHHKDKIRNNDDPENLQLMSKAEHDAIHAEERLGKTPWNKGKTQSEDHRRKIGEASRGRQLSEDARARISEFARNRTDLGRDEFGKFKT